MDLELLKMFITVAEQRHFSKAAELLHLTQPTVSMRIRQLEQQLNVSLLERSPKKVSLTPAGHLFVERARECVRLMEQTRIDIQRLSEEITGELCIGASYSIGEYVLPRLIAQFSEMYPQVQIRVSIHNTHDIVQQVYQQQLHGGLVEGRVKHKDMQIRVFAEDELILVVAPNHPLAIFRTVQIDQLQEQVWVLRETGSGTRSFSEEFITDYDLTIKRSFEISSNQGVKEAVRAGLGLSLLSRHVVQREVDAGHLRELTLIGSRCVRPLTIVQRKDIVPVLAWEQFLHLVIACDMQHSFTKYQK
ncbi:LysR family transcriptional regulator [Paenibacillus taiwanensis]|uniref:LysR family transcriptional regulator n=1 Tax=Paenibacillus taiwanensis TaxID=401638 RepID=UPI00048D34F4|nr:LysR family transcriptional regulator [Paenibacillus taiwanensis]